jgi:DNA-binding MarR family transcriptional regulator
MAIRAVAEHETLQEQPDEPGWGRSPEDEQASQMLLTFTRLLRGPRRKDSGMPKHVEALLKKGFLAPRHLGAFAVITLEGPLTVSELARQEGLALSTASLLVTQLAEAGLVERRADVSDRRRTVVSVAPEHLQESRAVLESKLAPLRRALTRMGPRRTRALLEGLNILVEEVTRTAGDTPMGAAATRLRPQEEHQ